MLLEIAKPVALMLCVVSLCGLFYTAFLVPASEVEQRMWDSLVLLSLTAGICLSSGMIFREPTERGLSGLIHTLPVQMFLWGVCMMLAFFVASWYLETHYVLYRDVRWY
jgi:hypothetical protein